MMKIVLIGIGVVGQGLAEVLRDKADDLRTRYNFEAQIVGVATGSRGTLFHPDGLDIPTLLDAIGKGHLDHYPDTPGLSRNQDSLTLVRNSNAEVMVEVSPTNLQTAQPALGLCYAALESGKHLVLANKGPIALAYPQLVEAAYSAKKRLLFESTVMAGTPSIRLAMQALQGCTISEARGILNGTTNYILTQMEGGMSYADALAQAQKLGYAETDPTADVDGWDAAGKGMILSQVLFNNALSLKDMDVKGISAITAEDVKAAQAAGERWKLIVRINAEGCSVQPMRLPLSNPLATVAGANNAITYSTDLLGDVTLVGAGAGRLQTAFGLLSDLLDISRAPNPY